MVRRRLVLLLVLVSLELGWAFLFASDEVRPHPTPSKSSLIGVEDLGEDECFDATAIATTRMVDAQWSAKVIFAPHHKTGFRMSRKCQQCINVGVGSEVAEFDMGRSLRDNGKFRHLNLSTKIIHFSRDPIKLMVSLYFYTRFGAPHEAFMLPDSATWVKSHLMRQELNHSFMEVEREESFYDYINRVDWQHGVRAILADSMSELDGIKEASANCRNMSNCMEVSENIMTQDSESYFTHWQMILKFAGIDMNTNIKNCLRQQDMHNAVFLASKDNNHCSSHKVSEDLVEEMANFVLRVDKEHFAGKLARRATRYSRQTFPAYGCEHSKHGR